MASEETLKEIYRYFKEMRNSNLEFTEAWRERITEAIEYRINVLGISEDDIVWSLITEHIMEKYQSNIDKDIFYEAAKFYKADLSEYENK